MIKRQEKRRPETSEIDCDDQQHQNYRWQKDPVFERAEVGSTILHRQLFTASLLLLFSGSIIGFATHHQVFGMTTYLDTNLPALAVVFFVGWIITNDVASIDIRKDS